MISFGATDCVVTVPGNSVFANFAPMCLTKEENRKAIAEQGWGAEVPPACQLGHMKMGSLLGLVTQLRGPTTDPAIAQKTGLFHAHQEQLDGEPRS